MYLSFYERVVHLIYSNCCPAIRQQDIRIVLARIAKWRATRGPVWASDYTKLARLAVTRYVSGHPLPEPRGISTTKDGIPRVLPHVLRELVRAGNPRDLSCILTILSVNRGILGGKPVNYQPIENPWDGNWPVGLKTFIQEELQALGAWRIKSHLPSTGFHWSTKSGPNGQALTSCLHDFDNLPDTLKESIMTVAPWLRLTFKTLTLWQERPLWSILNSITKTTNKGRIRKLSVKPDREAKSRVFGILDYWSQTALLPLHKLVFQLLQMFSTDCTFSQGNGLTLRAPKGHSYHSFDLSNATDRFPLEIQEFVVSCMMDQSYATAWKDIMVGYEFVDPTGKPRLFRTGQPMGAHSSWPIFTLCHHLIVQFSSFKAGLPAPFKDYRLLGDDIVIANDQVAAEYLGVMKDLDVPISFAKTHVSNDTFEMAKRWWHQGSEITPAPIHGFYEVRTKWHLVAELYRTVLERGFDHLVTVGVNPVISKLLSLSGYRGRQVSTKLKQIKGFLLVSSLTSKTDIPDKVMIGKRFLQLFGVPLRCTERDASFVKWFDNLACSVYYQTQEDAAERSRALVKKWQYKLITDLEEHPDLGPDDQSELTEHWYEVLPFLQALSNKSAEAYESVNTSIRASNLDPAYLIWDKLPHTKVLVLPVEGEIVPIRSAHLKAGSRAVFTNSLVKKAFAQLNYWETTSKSRFLVETPSWVTA